MPGLGPASEYAIPVEHSGVMVVCKKDVQRKKRGASDSDLGNTWLNLNDVNEDPVNGVQIDHSIDQPTMGEQLASLNTIDDDEGRSHEHTETSLPRRPPSVDSVHVLLKQALHADDQSLLRDCLFRQGRKVIANSVSLLNPSNVFKLLESLISMIQSSRGSVLVCALPWLKSLLLQHSSSILCQESSLIALNSSYQLIESRISTCNPAFQLLSSLDLLCTRAFDDDEGQGLAEQIIYEDKSDEEDTMESDEELEAVSNVSDVEGSNDMTDF